MATRSSSLPNRAPNTGRPIMLGVVGDSATGKTTITAGIAKILGKDRVTTICTDDYHKFDRVERKELPFTPLHPDCNYMEIIEQHLKLLADGEPILKPIYNHSHGTLDRPVLVTPQEYMVVEGLFGFYTKPMRDCFDVKVFLDPPEDVRRAWKIKRDVGKRNYTEEQVDADLAKREPESEAYIRPQRAHADIVVRFYPPGPELDVDASHYNVKLVLRPTLPHPYLAEIASATRTSKYEPIRFSLARDRGQPVDVLEIDGTVPDEVAASAEQIIWEKMHKDGKLDANAIGLFAEGDQQRVSGPLGLTQLLIVFQLQSARAGFEFS
ncbi:MAG TPA: phosphoribulokinase [Actinomycetota bacterium]|nr:phosphoribulokinase [Actinomycetota bacterium]